jgi:long-chain fatty acid transport protein
LGRFGDETGCEHEQNCYLFNNALQMRACLHFGEAFMGHNVLKLTALALLATVSTANAGGFSRGTADTDILYEDGNFNLRAGVTYVKPTRKITKGFAPLGGSLVGTNYTDAYIIPSAAVKINLSDDARCATTLSQPYGGSTSFAVPSGTSAKVSEQFEVTEYGLTCGYKFDLSKGQAWILGGVFQESLDYDLSAVGGAINVKLGSNRAGFRLGAAYAIPEIALRAELMYRSETEHDPSGTTTRVAPTGTPLDGLPLGIAAPVASGSGVLPQSIELKLQSGVAPGWLAFGSVKWTDWSATESLDLVIAPGFFRQNLYFWRDGVTVTGGIGHAFTDKISGAASLTWDRGVGTGWDLSSDTWTLGAGASIKDEFGGELKIGGGLTYIAGATETKYPAPLNTSVSSGWAYALGTSYKVKW